MIEFLFYAVFVSQIFLISVYYPKKTIARNRYVLQKYPASEYPKLYNNSYYADPVKAIKKTMSLYAGMNGIISLFGLTLLAVMALSGFLPSSIKQSENMIFILFFFMMQMVPHIVLEFSSWRWYKLMREARQNATRSADLKPRVLFDYISPFYVALAVFLYVAWLVFYIYAHRFVVPWVWNQYVSIIGITAINLLFAFTIFRFLRGQKMDPYQASQDRLKHIGAVAKVHVYGSIGMSLFLIAMELVNTYQLDMFEPVFMSAFQQLMAVFGLGTMLRNMKIEDIDFSVYKEDVLTAGN